MDWDNHWDCMWLFLSDPHVPMILFFFNFLVRCNCAAVCVAGQTYVFKRSEAWKHPYCEFLHAFPFSLHLYLTLSFLHASYERV